MTEPHESVEKTSGEIWYKSAGTVLFAVERGQGLPIVLLHGGLADHRATLYRFAALGASYRLIAPDVRGAGRSKFGGPLSWDLLADDIARLLDHLKLERCVIGGTSAGSAVSVRFALRHPERALALLALWPVYAGADVGLNAAQSRAMERMNEAGARTLVEGIDALVPLFAALPQPMRDGVVAMVRSYDPASVAATTRFLASGAQPIARLTDLGALAMPTLVIPGVDAEHPVDVATRYASAIPGAVFSEAAPDMAAAVDAFLRAAALTPQS